MSSLFLGGRVPGGADDVRRRRRARRRGHAAALRAAHRMRARTGSSWAAPAASSSRSMSRERRALIEVAVDAAAGPRAGHRGHGLLRRPHATSRSRGMPPRRARTGRSSSCPTTSGRPSREVVDHFRRVGRAVGLPVMAYNNPTNAAAPALMSAAPARSTPTARVARGQEHVPHGPPGPRAARRTSRRAFRVFYGSFMAPLEGLAGGAHGWISGILNVATPTARRLVDAIASSDLEGARAAWAEILPIKELYTRGPSGRQRPRHLPGDPGRARCLGRLESSATPGSVGGAARHARAPALRVGVG